MTNPSVLEQQEEINARRRDALYVEELRKNPLLDKYINKVAGEMYDKAWWDGWRSAVFMFSCFVLFGYAIAGVLL